MQKAVPMIGIRKNGQSSLILSYCRAISGQLKEATREVTHVFTMPEFRHLGYAKKLMAEVCAEADREGKMLIIFPKPYADDHPLSQEQLIDWYSSFDFDIVQTVPVVMMARAYMHPSAREQVNKTIQTLKENAE